MESHEVVPPASPRKHWTRKEITQCLVERLSEAPSAVVGIDHGFSFPLRYFEKNGLRHDWPAFLDDFQRNWPTDAVTVPLPFCSQDAAAELIRILSAADF
jgi:hypothetical protein